MVINYGDWIDKNTNWADGSNNGENNERNPSAIILNYIFLSTRLEIKMIEMPYFHFDIFINTFSQDYKHFWDYFYNK